MSTEAAPRTLASNLLTAGVGAVLLLLPAAACGPGRGGQEGRCEPTRSSAPLGLDAVVADADVTDAVVADAVVEDKLCTPTSGVAINDPNAECFKKKSGRVVDGGGRAHFEDFQTQLYQAFGGADAGIPAHGTPTCTVPDAYDCTIPVFNPDGTANPLPVLPPRPSGADFTTWNANVRAHFFDTYADAAATTKAFSPGEAGVCEGWYLESKKLEPDGSIMAAYARMQSMGATKAVGADDVWITNIFDAANAQGCVPPPADAGNKYTAAWIPQVYIAAWWDEFRPRESTAPDYPGPHDPPAEPKGNKVNSTVSANFTSAATRVRGLFINAALEFHDPNGGCDLACYTLDGE